MLGGPGAEASDRWAGQLDGFEVHDAELLREAQNHGFTMAEHVIMCIRICDLRPSD